MKTDLFDDIIQNAIVIQDIKLLQNNIFNRENDIRSKYQLCSQEDIMNVCNQVMNGLKSTN